jgi:hypothetical protein
LFRETEYCKIAIGLPNIQRKLFKFLVVLSAVFPVCGVYVGDDLFFPVRKRTYEAGNYAYAFFAKEWKEGIRISIGGYDFTRNVVANANRAGGQFTFEQRVNNRLTLASEWYTGKQAAGYVNPGAIIKLNAKVTLYGAYQIGNGGVTRGNHQFLWEIGYNFN